MIWAIIFGLALTFLITGCIYLSKKARKLSLIKKVAGDDPKKQKLWSVGILVLALGTEAVLLNFYDTVISFLFLFGIWAICDGIGKLINRIRKKEAGVYLAGYVAIVITLCMLIYGYISAVTVVETNYRFTSPKAGGEKLRVVQISDSHMGTTFDGEEFGTYTEQINRLQPDVVVITGDYVDDDTSYEDMVAACKKLGTLKTTYGVYYVFGNHDRGYYASQRGYTEKELVKELTDNGVVVLQDESVEIGEHYVIGGREDASVKSRMKADEFAATMDANKYRIVLDHQPHEYREEAEAGVNLVLSGHTHGGQFWPFLMMGEWFGINDMTYGHRQVDDTDYVVSSGIADWAFHIKTGCISEIVVMDIE